MPGRSGAEVAQRGSAKHLHHSRGVTVKEMREAWIAPLVDPAPAAPTARRRVLACLPALTRSGLCVTAG